MLLKSSGRFEKPYWLGKRHFLRFIELARSSVSESYCADDSERGTVERAENNRKKIMVDVALNKMIKLMIDYNVIVIIQT